MSILYFANATRMDAQVPSLAELLGPYLILGPMTASPNGSWGDAVSLDPRGPLFPLP